ncbi:MAG: LysR family transcriptional regulator [Pseudomonadota bacterium]|jgi:DNA-binding transcriptional LysR family regulator
MLISSDALAAFFAVAQTGNFSKAAKILHVTQSAVSQRVANLEKTLSTSLFVREHHRIQLTPAGETLRTYCALQRRTESEVLAQIANRRSQEKLQGKLRIASFSSVLRSVVLKSLHPLLAANPDLQLDAQSVEMNDLPSYLRSGKADFVVVDHEIIRPDVVSYYLGDEINVLAVPTKGVCPDRFLDHDASDMCTDKFRKFQSPELPDAPRHYVDDIYGILDGIEMGLGKGVIAAHLVTNNSKVSIVKKLRPLRVPLWLHHLKAAWETPLQQAVVSALKANTPLWLAASDGLSKTRSASKKRTIRSTNG